MRIKSIRIKNLLSFKDAKFNFKEYNVIVGPNNAGKTNLVRILRALADGNLNNFDLIQKMKRNDGGKPQIQLAVETTDEETRMIMQMLIDSNIKQKTDLRSWKNFTMGLGWSSLDIYDHAEPMIIYFQNNVLVSINNDEYRISHYAPPDTSDFEQRLDELCDMDIDRIMDAAHKGSFIPVKDERVRDMITDDPLKFFSNDACDGILGSSATINISSTKQHRLEIAQYVKPESRQQTLSLQQLILAIIRNSLLWSGEMHPAPVRLTENLYQLKNTNESAYNHLQKSFTDIFTDTRVRVERKSPDTDALSVPFDPFSNNDRDEQEDSDKDTLQAIWITERNKTFKLADSASGYLEAIHILYTILNHTQRTIFLDEPEVHFHPAKIRQISQMLSHLTQENRNQITVITHSPQFLDHGLLDPDSQSMLTMVTKVDGESLVSSPTSCNIRLKPHMFKPDVFFANAVFLVEGPSDEAVIGAISDTFGCIFHKYEIALVNCGGVGNIKPYADLLEFYSIKYYGMADKEYEHDDAITVLDGDLEGELQKITTAPFQDGDHQPSKPGMEVYYSYIIKILETREGFEALKQTKIWASIESVMSGIGVDMAVFEKKYKP